jgi:CRP-like cAMP-binding protein
MAIDTGFLSTISYFVGLSPEELGEVGKRITEKKVERGEMIIHEEEAATSLYFVYSGAVKVFKTSVEGKEQILAIIRPGQIFNAVPIFDDGNNPANAQAMTSAVLYELRKEDMMELLEGNCMIAENTIRMLAGMVREFVILVEDLSFRQVIGRVARILLNNIGDVEDTGVEKIPKLTQQDMAAMAGTAREVVGRSLKTLEDAGMVRLERNRVVITDKEALSNLVEATY